MTTTSRAERATARLGLLFDAVQALGEYAGRAVGPKVSGLALAEPAFPEDPGTAWTVAWNRQPDGYLVGGVAVFRRLSRYVRHADARYHLWVYEDGLWRDHRFHGWHPKADDVLTLHQLA
jgi:hypothetical protein